MQTSKDKQVKLCLQKDQASGTKFWNKNIMKHEIQNSRNVIQIYSIRLGCQWNKLLHRYLQLHSIFEKSIHTETWDVMKFLMCSVEFNMGTISGTTHLKTKFSFSSGNDMHFIDEALCSSDNAVTQLIHILNFFPQKFPTRK